MKSYIEERLEKIRFVMRRARSEKGLCQAAAARRMGIPRETLCCLESGKQRLTLEHLLLMCRAYGARPGNLLCCLIYGDDGL